MQADAYEDHGSERFDAVCAFSLLHLIDDIPGVLGALILRSSRADISCRKPCASRTGRAGCK